MRSCHQAIMLLLTAAQQPFVNWKELYQPDSMLTPLAQYCTFFAFAEEKGSMKPSANANANIIDVFFILFILSFSDLRISSVYADSFSVVFCQHSIYVLRMRTILLCPITFVVFLIKMGFCHPSYLWRDLIVCCPHSLLLGQDTHHAQKNHNSVCSSN